MATGNPLIPLYDGAIEAHLVGSFIKDGFCFDVIRPGFDAQGRKRQLWTQIVYQGVPIFEVKVQAKLPQVIETFETRWAEVFEGYEPQEIEPALQGTVRERTTRFKDGVSGETTGPGVTIDGVTSLRDFHK